MEQKLFTELKVGDYLYCNYEPDSIEVDKFVITNIKHITHEKHTYKEWAYGEEEEYYSECDKLEIRFDPVDKEKKYGWYQGNYIVVNLKYYNSYVLYSGQGVGHTWSPNEDVCYQDRIHWLQYTINRNNEQINKLTSENASCMNQIQTIINKGAKVTLTV